MFLFRRKKNPVPPPHITLATTSIPLYPNSIHLGGECVEAVQPHPSFCWNAYATSDSVEAVVTHYRALLGDDGFTADEEAVGGIWRLPAQAARPTHILHVLSVTMPGPYQQFASKIPADTQAILITT